MKHEIQEQPAGIVVAFQGDVDLQSSPDARNVLLDAVSRGRAVFVDLSGVGYIDRRTNARSFSPRSAMRHSAYCNWRDSTGSSRSTRA